MPYSRYKRAPRPLSFEAWAREQGHQWTTPSLLPAYHRYCNKVRAAYWAKFL